MVADLLERIHNRQQSKLVLQDKGTDLGIHKWMGGIIYPELHWIEFLDVKGKVWRIDVDFDEEAFVC